MLTSRVASLASLISTAFSAIFSLAASKDAVGTRLSVIAPTTSMPNTLANNKAAPTASINGLRITIALNKPIATPAVLMAVAKPTAKATILLRAKIAAVNIAMFKANLMADLIFCHTTSNPPASSMAFLISVTIATM